MSEAGISHDHRSFKTPICRKHCRDVGSHPKAFDIFKRDIGPDSDEQKEIALNNFKLNFDKIVHGLMTYTELSSGLNYWSKVRDLIIRHANAPSEVFDV